MKNKILILGKGYIGTRIQQGLDVQISESLIQNFKQAQELILQSRPRIVINAIGYIGRNVDACELDKESSLLSNSFVPLLIAEVCLRNKIRFVHISSGCIYHYNYAKDRPITEDKPPDFYELFYSRTKIYSELALENLSRKFPFLVVRIRVPLDDRPSPKNLLDKLIGFKKVIDLPNSITYIPDFIQALRHLIKIGATGVYNTVNKGALRYPQLLEVYRKYVPDFKYRVISYKEMGLVRTNLILSTKKLENSGFKVREIHEVLEECVQNYLKY
jgi:dTDP-4-dehydrorhamnose reductase